MRKTIVAAAVAWMAMGAAGSLMAAEKSQVPEPNFPSDWHGPGFSEVSEPGEVRSVRHLLGITVNGPRGERLGQVSQVLLDVARGDVAYVVVTPEPGTAQNQARIIPWRAISTNPRTADLTAHINAARFAEAPAATGTLNRQRAEEIHRFYGVAPYWEERQPARAPAVAPIQEQPRTVPPAPPRHTFPARPPAPEKQETPLWFE